MRLRMTGMLAAVALTGCGNDAPRTVQEQITNQPGISSYRVQEAATTYAPFLYRITASAFTRVSLVTDVGTDGNTVGDLLCPQVDSSLSWRKIPGLAPEKRMVLDATGATNPCFKRVVGQNLHWVIESAGPNVFKLWRPEQSGFAEDGPSPEKYYWEDQNSFVDSIILCNPGSYSRNITVRSDFDRTDPANPANVPAEVASAVQGITGICAPVRDLCSDGSIAALGGCP